MILCGGLAARLGTITSNIPKCMLQIDGKPFIFHQLNQLINQNISDVFLCLGHLGEKVEEYLSKETKLDINIKCVYDGSKLLGTGGCIVNALPYLPDEFFILYGDSYLNIDYAEVYKKYLSSQKSALLTIFHNVGQWDSSNVEIDNGIIKVYSKNKTNNNMHYIDYGLSILSKKILQKYSINMPFDLSEIFGSLSESGDIESFEAMNRFYEIGSKDGYVELNKLLSQKNNIW